jgi:hypothetical protein
MFGCETWTPTLREQTYGRLEISDSENRVLRRIFGPKRDELVRGWRKLHNEEFHNLHAFSNIIRMIKSRRMRWTRHVACI